MGASRGLHRAASRQEDGAVEQPADAFTPTMGASRSSHGQQVGRRMGASRGSGSEQEERALEQPSKSTPPTPTPRTTAPPRAEPSSLVRMRPVSFTVSLNSLAWLSMFRPAQGKACSLVLSAWW